MSYYLHVKYVIRPAEGAKTSSKNYMQEGEKNVSEEVTFLDRLRKNDILVASYIFDLENIKVIKNRFRNDVDNPVDDATALRHYLDKYANEIKELYGIVDD